MSYLDTAQRVIAESTNALKILSKNLPNDFEQVIDHIISFKGRVILTGIGKSGYIAKKISASFASTGTPSFYIHPAEASHGDLGMIKKHDIVILLSKSGETSELFNIVNYCKRFNIKIAGITADHKSFLGQNCDFLLLIPNLPEASLISAPSTSCLLMLALGEALTIATQEYKGFSRDDFFIYHPGGKIGSNLMKVKDIMRTGNALPVVSKDTKFSDAIIIITQKHLGGAFVVDQNTNLLGIITETDLKRHIDKDIALKYAKDVMNSSYPLIDKESLVDEVLKVMNRKLTTMLPVIENKKLIGAIYIHDIIKFSNF